MIDEALETSNSGEPLLKPKRERGGRSCQDSEDREL